MRHWCDEAENIKSVLSSFRDKNEVIAGIRAIELLEELKDRLITVWKKSVMENMSTQTKLARSIYQDVEELTHALVSADMPKWIVDTTRDLIEIAHELIELDEKGREFVVRHLSFTIHLQKLHTLVGGLVDESFEKKH